MHDTTPHRSLRLVRMARGLSYGLLLLLALAGAVVEGFGLPRAGLLHGASSRRPSILAFAGGADGKQPYKPKVWAYYRSRSKIIQWYLEELGVEYESVGATRVR